MIWGGLAGTYQNTGARYNPSTDLWSAVSTTGAPAGRQQHTALWMGGWMLVWGGFGDAFRNTGGRYALGQNTDLDGDGYSVCAGDCNDANPAIHPGAVEICNGVDDNCIDGIDEGFDQDADGLTSCGGDCDDGNPQVWQPPRETSSLTLVPPAALGWDSQDSVTGPGTSYDLTSGSLGPGTGIDFAAAACLQSASLSSGTDPRPDPAAGFAYWYLSRARNSCGVGTYGTVQRDASIPACP